MAREEVQGLFHTLGLAMSPRSLRSPVVNYRLNGVYLHLKKKKKRQRKQETQSFCLREEHLFNPGKNPGLLPIWEASWHCE